VYHDRSCILSTVSHAPSSSRAKLVMVMLAGSIAPRNFLKNSLVTMFIVHALGSFNFFIICP
jgi:hypothetical protein